MAKVSAVMLAVILAVGLGFVVARGASPPEHVYTVPQVLASLRALRGRTVLVRGVLVYGWVWGPRSALRPCQQSCGPIIYALEGAFPFGTPLLVFVGAQDPILALLREVHVLPPFARVELKPVPRVYRVQITPTCQRGGQCSAAILLDALR